MWSHGERLRGAVKRPKRSSEHAGGARARPGPHLYTVVEAAEWLRCSERKLRKEIAEHKITYRAGPGGISFMECDLIERLRPTGGPGASSRSKKRGKGNPSEIVKGGPPTYPCVLDFRHSSTIGSDSSLVVLVVLTPASPQTRIERDSANEPSKT